MASKKKKPSPPPKARPKKGTANLSEAKLVKKGKDYVAAAAQSPIKAQITTQATAVQTALDALEAKHTAHTAKAAELASTEADIVTAKGDLVKAIDNYVHEGGNLANGNAEVLKGLGIDAAAPTKKPKDQGPAAVVNGIRLQPGPDSGQAHARWPRPPGAAAFMAQYKLEPAPGAPATDWQPQGDGHATKNQEWLIVGMPPAAPFRFRLRAIGAEIGPWSDEVLGKAR